MNHNASTIDKEEVERFSRIAAEWWNPNGKFKPLHDLNAARVEWIKQRIQDSGFRIQQEPSSSPNPESRILNPTLLDIGCGGGLVSEPMARLGARVVGIDASEKNIEVARAHARESGLEIDYRCMAAEDLASSVIRHPSSAYDIVLALEIVEHVADVPLFVSSCAKLVKPGGLLMMSTLNRTLKSYALAIVGAEYVLNWLPRGTHDWQKFLKPSELCRSLQQNGITISAMTGLALNPISWKWELKPRDLSVNYMVAGKKHG